MCPRSPGRGGRGRGRGRGEGRGGDREGGRGGGRDGRGRGGEGREGRGRRGEAGEGARGEESRYIRMYVRSDTMYVCTKVGEASWTILYSGAKAYIYVRMYSMLSLHTHTYIRTCMCDQG